MSTIFISHSSRDNEIAAMMRQRLAERGHASVFLDFDPAEGIPVGQSWERTLYRKLEACDVVIVLFSDNHNASKWCFAEVALARMQGKHLITLLVNPIGDTTTVPSILKDYQYGDMRTHPEEAIDRLWRGLDELGIHPARVRSWAPTSPPYPGMLAFDEAQESIYFGRETETRALIALLSAARRRGTDRFVVVQGASGSGKSSLVRAGVVPRLRHDRHQWTVVGPLRAGANPMEQLAAHLARAFGDVFLRDDVMSQLAAGGLERAAFENRLRSGSPETAMLLVVIDQFEELLTCDDADGAADLLHLLDAACASDEVTARLLVTLRSDFVAELDRLDVPAMLRSRRDFSVGPMRTADMRRTITEPARLGALDLEDGLVDRLLDDTGTADGLPLLAFALRKLWDEAHHDGRLEVSEYERLGGLAGALADEAEAVLDAQPGGFAIREEIAAAFLRMSRLGTDGGYTRVTTIWNSHPESIHTALEQFVDRRILVSAGGDQGRTVEIAHDALFRAWPQLAEWLRTNTELLKLKQLVHDFSYRWHEDSDEGDLLRGTRLARVQELQALGHFELTDQERDFLKASVDAEVKRLQNEGNALGAVLADPDLRRLVEPRLAPVIAEVLAEQQRQRDESVFGAYEETAIRQDQIVSALSNVTNPRWHPEPAKSVGNMGARGNYLDKFTFPCCGKKVLGENSVSQFRADGCQPYMPDADKRSDP